MSAAVLLSVLAASLAIPQPGTAFSSAALAPRDGSGIAVVRLFVAPNRTVEDCKVVSSELSEADRTRICNSLRGKRAAKAAVGPDGQPAYGTLLYVVAENSEDASPRLRPNLPADVVLDVEALPGGQRSKSLSVNVLFDETGKVVRCEPSEGDAAYAQAACSSLDQQVLEARHDRDGKAVPYVENVTVSFVTRQASL